MSAPNDAARRAFHRLSLSERTTIADVLRRETIGGLLLLVASAIALVWANSPIGDTYEQLRTTNLAIPGLVELDVEHWASEGLLAVFFLVAGLELKREFVVGDLSDKSEAVLPVVAAVCGMIGPALVYVVINVVAADGRPGGWAVPVATDIAFALAVLAIVGSRLPTALRAFLLSLAVVDDLLAIVIIAIFFTAEIHLYSLLVAGALLAVFALLQLRRVTAWWLYIPVGLAVWFFVHEAGVHATVAGVAIGMVTRVRHDDNEQESPAERLEHRLRPLSASICIPIFALMAAGVALDGDAVRSLLTSPVAIGVAAGLILGKTVGITGGAWLAVKFTRAELSPRLAWSDVTGLGLLAGIGFTVSLLLAELSFSSEPEQVATAKAAVLAASVLAAVLATLVLRRRQAVHVAIYEAERRDEDDDGIPDVYQSEEARRRADQIDGDQQGS
ncbi:Na+/H+ antiporter NhaA [soil metagenome]